VSRHGPVVVLFDRLDLDDIHPGLPDKLVYRLRGAVPRGGE